MSVNSVSSPAFQPMQNTNGTTNSIDSKKDIKEVIKDNKGKIALGLSALAAVGIAAVAISRGKKVPSELSIDDFKKIGKFDKGTATVKGKPFSGIINVTNKRGNYALEYTDGALRSSTFSLDGEVPKSKKVYSEKDGTKVVQYFGYIYDLKADKNGQKVVNLGWNPTGKKIITSDSKVVKEHTDLSGEILQDIVEKQQDGSWKKTFQEMIPDPDFQHANYRRSYIATKDVVGNIIAKKSVYTPKSHISSQETVLKQANKYVDKDGSSVVETLKNGKLYARQTTKIADDGSRQIAVEYFDDGSKDYKKVIDIAKDGERKESEIGERFISL